MNNPLVTISILSYNRLDDLKVTMSKVLNLNYTPIEIILLDQNSNDGSSEYIKLLSDTYPYITKILSKKNLGIAGGRQAILNKSNGDYILTIDDDSYPSPEVLELAIEWFKLNPKLGAIGCNLLPPKRSISIDPMYPHRLSQSFDLFTGSGAIIRRESIPDGWDSKYMYSCEDTDLGLQIIRNGWYIKNIPDLIVRHSYSPKNRNYNHKIEKFAEGYVRVAYKYMSRKKLKQFLKQYIYDAIKYGIKHRTFAYILPLFKVSVTRKVIPDELFNNILLPYKPLFGYWKL
jgi:GT2 family glycosyltransferase